MGKLKKTASSSLLDQPKLQARLKKLPKVYQQFGVEMRKATELMECDGSNYSMIWWHLERAHILSQASAWRHFGVHLSMLGVGITSWNFREAFWQIPRLLLAVPSSLFGFAPRGNTGRSTMGIFATANLPKEFEALFKS